VTARDMEEATRGALQPWESMQAVASDARLVKAGLLSSSITRDGADPQ
jgi:hypothetical protein